jgi:hypothetical protein
VIDLATFSAAFPANFWKKINKQYLDVLEKQDAPMIVEGVYNSLNNLSYYPSRPRYYIDKNKGSGVLRRIPVMEPRDYAVYFYCIKKLEAKLAINRVESTYGGWSLGGLLRQKEDEELKPLLGSMQVEWHSDSSIPTLSYNEFAWAKYYGDYQKKLYATLLNYHKQIKTTKWVVVKFDIENFYDSIRIHLLEKAIRAVCDKTGVQIIDLLIHFIKYWNRDVNGYGAQETGIPQDALADCSRILANFYLQDYDLAMSTYVKADRSAYFRYADDQIIVTSDLKAAEDALHRASLELSRWGLNINKAKVSYHTIEELIDHFSFPYFKALSESKNDPAVLDKVARHYLAASDATKKNSLLYKILAQDLSVLRHDLRTQLLSDAFKSDFITIYANSNVLSRIYNNLGHDEKISFLDYLDNLSLENEFTGFHFELLTFYRLIKKDTAGLIARIGALQQKWR